jgi:hypothetical protein
MGVLIFFLLAKLTLEKQTQLPKNFSWHDVDGVNYLTTNVHQSVN